MRDVANAVCDWASNRDIPVSFGRDRAGEFYARITFTDSLGEYGWNTLLEPLEPKKATKKSPPESEEAWLDRIHAAMKDACVKAHAHRLKTNVRRFAA
jgi:hypothetical protein